MIDIAERDKVYMPMGAGGLIRYGEEEKQLIRLKPKHLIGFIIVVIILEIILKFAFA